MNRTSIQLICAVAWLSTRPAFADDSLQEAYRILSSKRFVDLTHTFSPSTPVWGGFGQATFSAAADPKTGEPYTIDKHGFRTAVYTFAAQYGTHVDAPAHFAKNGRTLDALPVKDMILPLIVLDATPLLASDPNHAYSVDDKRAPFPAWSLKAVQFLFEQRKIIAIGHESLDTDVTEKMEAETWLLKQDHFQIEVMNNLDQLPARGALIVVTWPKPQGGVGFPVRAFAILP